MPDVPFTGLRGWSPGEIAWIEIRDGESFESLNFPTREDIASLCRRYEFDVQKTFEVIDSRNLDQHGFLFDAPTWREWCAKSPPSLADVWDEGYQAAWNGNKFNPYGHRVSLNPFTKKESRDD